MQKELNYEKIKEKIDNSFPLSVKEFAFAMDVKPHIVYIWTYQGMPIVSQKPKRIDYKKAMKWLAEGGNTKK